MTRALAVACAAALLCGSVLSPASTRADHTAQRRELDYTAYVLHHGEVRAGLTRAGVGLFDVLDLQTTIPVWALAAVYKAAAPNIRLKAQFFDLGGVALGGAAGVSYVVGRNTFVEGDKLRVTILTFDLPVSWRVNSRWTVSLTTTVAHLIVGGNVPLPLLDIEGDTVGDNVHFSTQLEYRVDPRLAIQLRGFYLPYRSDAVVGAHATLSEGSDADLSIGIETPQNTGAVELVGAYSWKKLELRVGAAWGSYFAFGSGLVLTTRTPYPVFDIYYRY